MDNNEQAIRKDMYTVLTYEKEINGLKAKLAEETNETEVSQILDDIYWKTRFMNLYRGFIQERKLLATNLK